MKSWLIKQSSLTLADHQPVPADWLLLALALALDERIQKDLANVL
jgi:hypothetical protein